MTLFSAYEGTIEDGAFKPKRKFVAKWSDVVSAQFYPGNPEDVTHVQLGNGIIIVRVPLKDFFEHWVASVPAVWAQLEAKK